MNAHAGGASGKTSSDSGTAPVALDRWSQRRLQRLNTEQGFREQRQGGPPATAASLEQQSFGQPGGGPSPYANAQPQQSLHQHHPQQQSVYQTSRTASGLSIQTQNSSNAPLRSPAFQSQAHHQPQQQQQQQQHQHKHHMYRPMIK
jgi:hypothetical protein